VSARATLLASLLLLSSQTQPAQPPAKLESLLEGKGPVTLTIEAPIDELFQKGLEDEKIFVPGKVTFKDPGSGADVVLTDVAVSVRGHTSRRETECGFPKLKLKLKGAGSVKIGTHCDDAGEDQLSPKYGRLQNEKSAHREALVYDLLRAIDAPTLKTRPARITYIDKAKGGAPLVRNALLLEDDDDAMKRVGGTAELAMETFGDVTTRGALADGVRIAFAQAMIGNFDWHLKMSPEDKGYRGTDEKPLWNVVAFDKGGSASLVMKDFDLAGIVVGRHGWFDKVWNSAFVPSKSRTEIEVLSQVQRTRSLFPRALLDAERQRLLGRKSAVDAAIAGATVDEKGRQLARAYVDAFYAAIADAQYYRPIVARNDVRIFLDPEGTKEACAPNAVMRAGTPVNEIKRSGTMSQVIILDAQWRWASKNECNAVQDGPVWIPSDAIVKDYPAK
jgi:hypothetical protein